MKKKLRAYLILLPISSFIVAFDQLTKSLVRNNLAIGEIWAPWDWLIPYARVVHWSNTGVAFGMFQNNNVLFSIMVSIIVLIILFYYPQLTEGDVFLKIALSLQLGGAVGNLIDRLMIAHVTDFISVGNFAVFNVADASVTVGVGIMILGLWVQEKNHKKSENEDMEKVIDVDS